MGDRLKILKIRSLVIPRIKTKLFDNRQVWVRGIMVLDVGCEFRDRGSIPSECQIPRDVDLGQLYHSLGGLLLD